MKIWVIKHFYMTRIFICSILVLAICGNSTNSWAGLVTKTSVEVIGHSNGDDKAPLKSSADIPVKTSTDIPIKNVPLKGANEPVEKGHGQSHTMDETPHIHHFHKHRVKKLKRHHKKCWFVSQAIIIICQVVLLVLAFMHVAH
jgi:hypothetical protein